MTEEQMNEMLEAAKPAIIESIKKELAEGITYEAKNAMASQIREHVQTWVQDNVLPEVTKQLTESKEGLISVGCRLGEAMMDEMVKGITETISENMQQSYKRRKIFEELLG